MSLVQSKNNSVINEALFEKVILQNDLSGLSPLEKVQHVKNVCISLGLNPLTKPIQLHKFQGKEVMYMGKDGAEQIRNLHEVSINKLETEILNGDLYVVKAYATKPSGRQDCSTSAISIANLKGEAIGNAMKKCETQAKRRVTLSICGLGILDESEIEDLPKDAYKPHINQIINNNADKVNPLPIANDSECVWNDEKMEESVNDILSFIDVCTSIEELQKIFSTIKGKDYKSRPDLLNKLIHAKNEKKKKLEIAEFTEEFDQDTGEIK